MGLCGRRASFRAESSDLANTMGRFGFRQIRSQFLKNEGDNMDDVEWRNLIRKTAGKMIHIADYLGVLNNSFDGEITIDEAIKRLEAYFNVMLEVGIKDEV